MSHSLPRRYFKKLISNFISLASGFIVTSIVPRALGPQAFGKFSFITDIYSQIFIFLESGSSNALYNKISHDHQNVLLLRKYSKFLFLVNLLVFCGLAVAFSLDLSKYIFADIEARFILMGLCYSSLFWINSIYIKVLDGMGKTSEMEQQRIYASILRACGIISLFFIHQITLVNFFIFQILLVLGLNISFLRLIYRNSRQHRTQPCAENTWQYFYQYSAPLFIYGTVSATAMIADRWMLQNFSGLSQQGYFSLATQLGAICFIFSSSLIPLFHREIAIAKEKEDLKGAQNIIYKTFPLLFFIAAALGIFCSVNSEDIIFLVAGEQYSDKPLAYSLMFLYPIHQTYGQLIGTVYYASGDTKLYRNIGSVLILIGMATSFLLLAPTEMLGFNLGFTGIALKNFVLQLFNVHILLYFSFRKVKIKIAPFVVNQIAVLTTLGGFAYLSKLTAKVFILESLLPKLFFSGILFLGMIIGTLYICYKNNIPILMKYTKENIEFIRDKIANIRKNSPYFK